MKEKSLTDTVLTIAMMALAAAFVVTLIWVAKQAPWLRTAHTLFFMAAIYGVSAAKQVRADRRLDEVELAAARFGSRWGLVGGVAVAIVLAFLPPVQSLLIEYYGAFGRIEDNSMTAASRLFLLGILTTFIAQEIFRSIFAATWKWSKQ